MKTSRRNLLKGLAALVIAPKAVAEVLKEEPERPLYHIEPGESPLAKLVDPDVVCEHSWYRSQGIQKYKSDYGIIMVKKRTLEENGKAYLEGLEKAIMFGKIDE